MTGGVSPGTGGLAQAPSGASDSDRSRIGRYAQNLRLYQGYLDQVAVESAAIAQARRLKHNLLRPIADLAADWTVGPELGWQVVGDNDADTERLTQAAVDIWDRSGGLSAFAQAAQTASVYGDLAVVARSSESGARLSFPDPSVCLPVFNAHDCSVLDGLTISYKLRGGDWHREEIEGAFAAWCPNRALLGQPIGEGEFESVVELVAEYDHVRTKKTRIIDYYAKPTPVLEGVRGAENFGDLNTVLMLPAGAKAYFLEWSGSQPDVEEHLSAMRWSICAVSQTPPIAFAEVDKTFSGSSGVALKVMFGPLESKTARRRNLWGPKLARAMAAALALDGFDVDPRQVAVQWRDATPGDESEQLDNVETLGRIGLSRAMRLRKLGYDEREISDNETQLAEERTQAAEQSARIFSRGPEV